MLSRLRINYMTKHSYLCLIILLALPTGVCVLPTTPSPEDKPAHDAVVATYCWLLEVLS